MSQFPVHLARFRNAEIVSTNNTINPNPKAYKRIVRKGSLGHSWELNLETVPFNYELGCETQAFVNSIGGQFGVFNIYNPLPPLGLGGGTPQTRTELTQNATSIPVELLPASVTGVWKAMDFIQFGNHPKVYQVNTKINSSGTGQSTATIFPPLIKDVPINTSIKFGSDVNFQVELENDDADISFAVSRGKRVSIEISCREVG